MTYEQPQVRRPGAVELRRWRLIRELSQELLAKELRTNRIRLGAIERGQSLPDIDLAARIHHRTGIDPLAFAEDYTPTEETNP